MHATFLLLRGMQRPSVQHTGLTLLPDALMGRPEAFPKECRQANRVGTEGCKQLAARYGCRVAAALPPMRGRPLNRTARPGRVLADDPQHSAKAAWSPLACAMLYMFWRSTACRPTCTRFCRRSRLPLPNFSQYWRPMSCRQAEQVAHRRDGGEAGAHGGRGWAAAAA